MEEYEKMRKETAEMIYKMISKFMNNMSNNPKDAARLIFDHLKNDHRTLQQSVAIMLLNVLYLYGQIEDNRTDLRNEYSVKLMRDIAKFLDEKGYSVEHDGKYIPAPFV